MHCSRYPYLKTVDMVNKEMEQSSVPRLIEVGVCPARSIPMKKDPIVQEIEAELQGRDIVNVHTSIMSPATKRERDCLG